MLLYSVVLSRTCDVIKKDMGKSQDALLTENARSTRVSEKTTNQMAARICKSNTRTCYHNFYCKSIYVS